MGCGLWASSAQLYLGGSVLRSSYDPYTTSHAKIITWRMCNVLSRSSMDMSKWGDNEPTRARVLACSAPHVCGWLYSILLSGERGKGIVRAPGVRPHVLNVYARSRVLLIPHPRDSLTLLRSLSTMQNQTNIGAAPIWPLVPPNSHPCFVEPQTQRRPWRACSIRRLCPLLPWTSWTLPGIPGSCVRHDRHCPDINTPQTTITAAATDIQRKS